MPALHSGPITAPDELLVVNNASTDETSLLALSGAVGPVSDWDWWGRVLIRGYDFGGASARHLYSWKTLVRCEKSWPAIKQALKSNVDVALTLFRNGSWAA